MPGGEHVLVTGAAGWLGLNLVRALGHGIADCPSLAAPQPGIRVKCLVLPGQEKAELRSMMDGAEIIEGDVRQGDDCRTLCEGAEGATLFHCAAVIHPGKVADFQDVNVQGTANLLEAATAAGVKRAVIVSSNSPCGNNPHPDHLFDEQSPYNPYMGYGRSKMRMEQTIHEHQSRGKLETVIVRAPWLYGPNQPPRQTLFFKMIRDGKMPVVGSGNNRRSMGYVDNICQALLLAADKPEANGETYWAADARPYTMNEIVETVETLLEDEFDQKCAHKRMKLPSLAGQVAQLVDASLQKVGVYHQKIHVLSEMNKTIACSIDKARRELGYDPAIDLVEGMRRSIRWCFDKGFLP